MDAFIHEIHEKNDAEKQVMMTHHSKVARHREPVAESAEKADIHMPRGDAFFRMADQFMAELFEERVVCVVTDINYFKLYNDIFGRKAGNAFLETIGSLMQGAADRYQGICGYMGGDNFCLIMPTQVRSAAELMPTLEKLYKALEFPDGFSPAMGVYYSEDRRESAITLYDRASSALAEIKGDYMRHIHLYSDETQRHHKEDKLLLLEVKDGLARGEFIFYVQPQVNERTGKIIGGEALVRWQHDGKLVPPGKFIPMLEKTGYVYAVDCHVWESVAKWQRSVIDRGMQPVPVSVNVSRVDFYFGDIAEHFIELVKKYDIPPQLLGVEITESAFTDNTDVIVSAIRRLQEFGFHILMDDFGSGSSSLSMLHTMNLDVLKTDVQFMSKDNQDSRAISIVESVISMAHLIGMSVVTEGVETEEQKNSLIAMGENFAQGYYFYKPMPVEQFEMLIREPENVAAGYKKKKDLAVYSGSLRFSDMIREGLVSESLLGNLLRAAAVLREEAGNVSIVQLNEPYASITGIEATQRMDSFSDDLDEPSRAELQRMLREANAHPLGGSGGVVNYRKADGSTVRLDMRLYLLYSFENHRLYLSVMG